MTNVAHVAGFILESFSKVGEELPEGWIKFLLSKTDETVVDATIDELLDAGFLKSSVVQHADKFAPVLVLTDLGHRAVAA